MSYKILKLNNGEELIASVVENENTFILSRPMVFINSTMTNPHGMTVDVTFLKDWLNNSDDKDIEIKKDQILAIIEPSKKCSSIYDGEKEREDNKTKIDSEEDIQKDMEKMADELSNFIDTIMSGEEDQSSIDYQKVYEQEKRDRRRKKRRKKEMLDNSMIPKELRERPMLYLNMVIPPEAIMNLLTSGLLEPDMLLKMIEEVKKKNKFTGDEKTREDFGNLFSDWNPDPLSDDYS